MTDKSTYYNISIDEFVKTQRHNYTCVILPRNSGKNKALKLAKRKLRRQRHD